MKTLLWFISLKTRAFWLIAVLGLVVTFGLWRLAISYRTAERREDGERITGQLATSLSQRFEKFTNVVDVLRTLRAASREIDDTEWRTALDVLGMSNFPEWETAGITVPSSLLDEKAEASDHSGLPLTFQHLTVPINDPLARKQIEALLSQLVRLLPQAYCDPVVGFVIPLENRFVFLRPVKNLQPICERNAQMSAEIARVFRETPFVLGIFNSQRGLAQTAEKHQPKGTVRLLWTAGNVNSPTELARWSNSRPGSHSASFGCYRSALSWDGPTTILEYQPDTLRAEETTELLPALAIGFGLLFTSLGCALVAVSTRFRRGVRLLRRRYKTLLDEQEKRYYTIFNTVSEGVLILDDTGHIQECNPAAARILGYPIEEMRGKSLCDFCATPCSKETDQASCPQALLSGSSETPVVGGVCRRIRRPSGDVRQVMFQTSMLVTGGDKKYVVALHDVTQLNETYERLEQTAQHLQAANVRLRAYSEEVENAARAKIAFLASMSHEIRTPLTAILGYAQLLAMAKDEEGGISGQVPPQQFSGSAPPYGTKREERSEAEATSPEEAATTISWQQAVEGIVCNSLHLQDVINNILDYSKLESGRLEIEKLPCEPVPLVRDVLSMLAIKAKGKNLSLGVEIVGSIPRTIQTDPTRLRQILLNLVDNAIKFTSEGRVWVEIELDQTGPERPMLEFRVCDTGMGMSPDQIGRLFQPFRQASEKISRQFGGTGLGLAISRQLARLLGGDVWVESTPGKGSIFHVRIALGDVSPTDMITAQDIATPGEAVKSQLISSPSTAGPDHLLASAKHRARTIHLKARILLAEDSPDNQRLIRYFLERAGAQVEVASNGQEALEKYHEAVQKGKQYDLLLMDVEMPVMDGPQAVRQLRAIGCQTPIVALTAHTDPVCVQQFLQSGYTGLIPKPVDRDGLLEAVASILTPRGTKIPTLVQVNEQQWMDHMGASGLVLPVVNQ